MKYKQWLKEVPLEITNDKLWNLTAYQYALYLSDLCFNDCRKIQKMHHYSMANQLYRSVGSISANTAEGFTASM